MRKGSQRTRLKLIACCVGSIDEDGIVVIEVIDKKQRMQLSSSERTL